MADYDFYLEKPDLVENEQPNNWVASLFSIVLFVMVFMYFFENEINFILMVVLVLFVHELGHFLMMKLFGYKNVRMFFLPLMGAFVHGKKDCYSQKESLIVVGMGPFPGVFIGVMLMLLSQNLHSIDVFQVGLMFFILNIINLAPLDPLDGGQFVKLLFGKNQELLLLIFSFVSSLLIIFIGFYLDSMLLMLFGFFMGFRVRVLQKNYYLHKEMKDLDIKYVSTYKDLSNKDFWKIKKILIENTPTLRKYVEIEEDENELNMILASQVNSVLITPVINDANKIVKIIAVLLWIFSLISPFVLYYFLDLNWVQYAISNW